MKREEVKAKIPGISEEQLQWLMDENGADVNREIKRANDLQQELDSSKKLLKTAQDGLKAFDGVDVADLKGQITTLQAKLTEQADAHKRELAERDFAAKLDTAILAKHGRSGKAIRAMLDVDALKASKDQDADIGAALDALAKDSAWLFDTGATPPPFAAGTGTHPGTPGASASLRAAMGLPAEPKQ